MNLPINEFDPTSVWSDAKKIKVFPESLFKDSDFDKLMTVCYWKGKETKSINEVIVCDYVILKCVSKEKLEMVYKMYDAFCKSFLVGVNEEDSEIELLNHFSNLKNKVPRFDNNLYVILKRSRQEISCAPYFLFIPGPQAKKFVNFMLFDKLFRNFCWKHEISLNRLDVKCICERKLNLYKNGENHLQLKELLQKEVVNSKRKSMEVHVEDSSHEYKDVVYVEKLGTTTYVTDYKYVRRIYNYVKDNDVHFELQQSNSFSIKPYNALYNDSTKTYGDFVELMKSTFVTEFSMLKEFSHDLTKDFVEKILKEENVFYKTTKKIFNAFMRYLYQPELKENPNGELLVSSVDNFVVNTKLTPVILILYDLCQLRDLNNQVAFTRREIIDLLGWKYTKKSCLTVENSLNELWCGSYLIENSDIEIKARLITMMETFKKGERRYRLTLNREFFENSLSKNELNQTFLKFLYCKYKKELEKLNLRQFPTVMFYQIYMFLSTTCYETGNYFPYKVSKNYESEQNFYVLFNWMLVEFHSSKQFETKNMYSELKEACDNKSLLKRNE